MKDVAKDISEDCDYEVYKSSITKIFRKQQKLIELQQKQFCILKRKSLTFASTTVCSPQHFEIALTYAHIISCKHELLIPSYLVKAVVAYTL